LSPEDTRKYDRRYAYDDKAAGYARLKFQASDDTAEELADFVTPSNGAKCARRRRERS